MLEVGDNSWLGRSAHVQRHPTNQGHRAFLPTQERQQIIVISEPIWIWLSTNFTGGVFVVAVTKYWPLHHNTNLQADVGLVPLEDILIDTIDV